MPCRSAHPSNCNSFEHQTTALVDNRPAKPIGTESNTSQAIHDANAKVITAVHGLVFNLLPDPSNPYKWSDSVLIQTLAAGNIFEDVLNKYLERVANGSIEISKDKKIGTESELRSPQIPALMGATQSVLGERLKETSHVLKLIDAAESLGKLHWDEVKAVFLNKEFTKICVVITTVVIGGGIIAGIADVAQRTKNDTLAKAVTAIPKLIPSFKFEAGDLQLKINGGINEIQWKPSVGQWKAGVFIEGEWSKSKLTVKGRVDFYSDQAGYGGSGNVNAVYKVGETYLDSVGVGASALKDGRYEVLLQLNKSINTGDSRHIDLFIGAKYTGHMFDKPAGYQRGAAAVAGFKIRIGD